MVRLILCQEPADSLEEYEFACTRGRVDRDESVVRFPIRLTCELYGTADLSIWRASNRRYDAQGGVPIVFVKRRSRRLIGRVRGS